MFQKLVMDIEILIRLFEDAGAVWVNFQATGQELSEQIKYLAQELIKFPNVDFKSGRLYYVI